MSCVINDRHTILDLKRKIFEEEGIPIDAQDIKYKKKSKLNNEEKLYKYSVNKNKLYPTHDNSLKLTEKSNEWKVDMLETMLQDSLKTIADLVEKNKKLETQLLFLQI